MSTDPKRFWYDLLRRLGHGPDLGPFELEEAWDEYRHSPDLTPDPAVVREGALGRHAPVAGTPPWADKQNTTAFLQGEQGRATGFPLGRASLGNEAAWRELYTRLRGSLRAEVLEAMAQMEGEDRELLSQRHLEGLSFEAMARIHGGNRASAIERYMRAFSRLERRLAALPADSSSPSSTNLESSGGPSMLEQEKRTLQHLLQETGGDRLAAAQRLGVGLGTFYRKLEQFGLD